MHKLYSINIPSLLNNIKTYSQWKQTVADKNEWKVTGPEEQGMDGAILKTVGKFLDKDRTCSFLVVRHGAIVYEKYLNGTTEGNYNNVYSVTKSIVSALTGIAQG